MTMLAARFSGRVWAATCLVFILIIYTFIHAFSPSHKGDWAYAIAAFVLFFVFVYAYLHSARSYSVSASQVAINRVLGKKRIAMERIVTIAPVTYRSLSIRIKLFGTGGVWGTQGIYYSLSYGKIIFETTNLRDELVLIILDNNKKYVLSPNAPAAFIRETESVRQRHNPQ